MKRRLSVNHALWKLCAEVLERGTYGVYVLLHTFSAALPQSTIYNHYTHVIFLLVEYEGIKLAWSTFGELSDMQTPVSRPWCVHVEHSIAQDIFQNLVWTILKLCIMGCN